MTDDDSLLWTRYSVNGVPIRLTREPWEHIIGIPDGHSEMQEQYSLVLSTLENPDFIQRGNDIGAFIAVRFYPEIPGTQKFAMVVYRELSLYDGYIVTAYLRSRPSSSRQIIWTKQ